VRPDDSDPMVRGLGGAPTDRASAGRQAQDPVDAHVLSRGDRLARFVVLNRVGTGGMGIVYVAHDPLLNRQVALKVLRPGARGSLRGQEARTRLLREAQAMARLSHPNVIAVHEVGTVEDEIFLVMELNDGGTLSQWLEAARRPWREVVDVFVEAGRGLQAAHRAGLTHRDFKPDNVLLSRDGRVRVVDFGLVHAPVAGERPTHPPTEESPLAMSLTHTGAVLGTPPYMAPEQHRAEAADPRTDQFSFCIALHEGLYGRRPFLGDTYAELVGNVLDGVIAPPPPSDVPPAVHQVLLRGLSADRAGRYPSIEVLLDELCAYAQVDRRRRASSAPLGPGRRDAPRRGRRIAVLGATLVAAGALALAITEPWLEAPLAPAAPAAVDPTAIRDRLSTAGTGQNGAAIDTPVPDGAADAGTLPASTIIISDTESRERARSSTRARGRGRGSRRGATPRIDVDREAAGEPTPSTDTAAERRRRELELSP
jgi:hypothetical protein